MSGLHGIDRRDDRIAHSDLSIGDRSATNGDTDNSLVRALPDASRHTTGCTLRHTLTLLEDGILACIGIVYIHLDWLDRVKFGNHHRDGHFLHFTDHRVYELCASHVFSIGNLPLVVFTQESNLAILERHREFVALLVHSR